MNGIVVITILIFVSGLIAYLGDRIGLKMGKKRVSIFGLRPKYSSIIITIVTGILIALLSLGILLLVYSNLRQALFNINDVMRRLDSLNQQLEKRDSELQQLKGQIELRQQEIAEKNAEIEKKNKDIAVKEKELASLQAQYASLQTALSEAEADIAKLEKNRSELQARIQDLDQERADLEEEISQLNDELTQLNADYQEMRNLANQFRAGVIYYMGEDIVYQKGDIIYSDVLEAGRSEEATIAALNNFLQKANEVAKEKDIQVNEDTGMALRLQTEDIMNAAGVIYNMEADSRVIVSLVARINVPKNDWLHASFMLNENFIVFNKGQQIVEKVINADQPASGIEHELENILDQVNQEAINRGLLPDNSGQVGSINFGDFYDLVNQIKTLSGEVKVSVQATEDIWREDRFSDNLHFEIEEVQ